MSNMGGMGMNSLQGFGGLSGLNGLGGLNLSALNGNPNLGALGNNGLGSQSLNPGNLTGQNFPQGLGMNNMMPNLQNIQTLQALQSLGIILLI
jgi:hypothetical protein